MKNLKTYHQLFESAVELTPEQIEWLDECTDGTWTLNPQTGLVDVKRDFYCTGENLTDFKGVRFGVVEGYFYCNSNNLTSLVGAPHEVGRDFNCHSNQLTTLEGAPHEVGGNFDCDNNQLTTLEGAPRKVGDIFGCRGNQLTSLVGAPHEVGSDFYCHNNQLTTLEGAPQRVGRNFRCDNNQLTSLVGAPKRVGGYFKCDNNQLTSLEGAPRIWEGSYISVSFDDNPVSNDTLRKIFSRMNRDESYLHAVENIWKWVPLEDQALLYRPEFDWVKPEARRKLEALQAYHGFKGMI